MRSPRGCTHRRRVRPHIRERAGLASMQPVAVPAAPVSVKSAGRGVLIPVAAILHGAGPGCPHQRREAARRAGQVRIVCDRDAGQVAPIALQFTVFPGACESVLNAEFVQVVARCRRRSQPRCRRNRLLTLVSTRLVSKCCTLQAEAQALRTRGGSAGARRRDDAPLRSSSTGEPIVLRAIGPQCSPTVARRILEVRRVEPVDLVGIQAGWRAPRGVCREGLGSSAPDTLISPPSEPSE